MRLTGLTHAFMQVRTMDLLSWGAFLSVSLVDWGLTPQQQPGSKIDISPGRHL